MKVALKSGKSGLNKKKPYPLLSTIDSPDDLKKLREPELVKLAGEMRSFIIDKVSRTGGHLGSNLGSVELTIALHYAYEAPRDLIVWDVGAQAYSHKILSGRRDRFHTNRQYGGIAPFPTREESPYDTFGVGHSSTSISAALGMATARDLSGDDFKVVAVIGDGGMTGGMAFEGLNNAGAAGVDLTVVLNDNSMAISPNIGALSQSLSSIRADPRFERLKDSMWQLSGRLPKSSKLRKALRGVDAGIRAMLIPGLWFERLGFRYVGPIDGHNLPELVRLFKWLRGISGPVLIHVLTRKGKGYRFAEEDSFRLHGVSKFDPQTGPRRDKGRVRKDELTFSAHFSDELFKIAAKNPKLVVVTPAMIEGSALVRFQEAYPDRCFDVGIAEQHAVTFAAGLVSQGLRPVVAIYSTFLQRAFDQVIHDVALQKLPVVFGVDRAGLVGEDGPTHHGAFDISYLRHIPGINIFVARNGQQLRAMLRAGLKIDDGPVAIRFARGIPPKFETAGKSSTDVWRPELLREGTDGLIIGVGPLLSECLAAAEDLAKDNQLELAVLDLRCIKPLDTEFLTVLAARYPRWMSVEENALSGGVGSALLEFLADRGLSVELRRLGLPDRFITHGDRASLLREVGLERNSIGKTAHSLFKDRARPTRHRVRTARLET